MKPVVVLLGPTGAGKSEQAKLVATRRHWNHLSSGELLRKSGLLDELLNAGKLAPSQMVEELIEQEISTADERPIVLDGFPRLLDEAVWLDQHVSGAGRHVARAILIELSREESAKRLKARQRHDDTAAAIAEKWHEYQTETLPVLEYYRQLGLLTAIDGRGSIEEVYERLERALQ